MLLYVLLNNMDNPEGLEEMMPTVSTNVFTTVFTAVFTTVFTTVFKEGARNDGQPRGAGGDDACFNLIFFLNRWRKE